MIKQYRGRLADINEHFEDVVINSNALCIIINKSYNKKFKDVLDFQYWSQWALQKKADDAKIL